MAIGTSWGRLPRHQQRIIALRNRFEALPASAPLLPYGNGRSYGDVCLNEGGTLVTTRALNQLIAFDPTTGILECESGILLSEIIDLLLPKGWFPAVVPGTAYVTVGGAIANDVHGKNHHRVGTFAHHVLSFELLRSDGLTIDCSRESNPEWFRATIGGLGLTGLIRRARLRLRPVSGPWIDCSAHRFLGVEPFLRLTESSDRDFEYTVAWIDSTSRGSQRGRGIFMCGNHASAADAPSGLRRTLRIPLTLPISALTNTSARWLNALYFRRARTDSPRQRQHYQDFHFPLDRILEWNRLYGPRGFFQYQCAIPSHNAAAAVNEMLERMASARHGSFVSVLKKFGNLESLGMLSFARPGVTFALDLPNRGAATLRLLEALDTITQQAGGVVYPAKDARMSARSFQTYFPAWVDFRRYIDPHFSSSFWRRVTAQSA